MAFISIVLLFYSLACSLLVTTALPATNADEEVIYGYREVSKEQAERYNKAGTLTDDPNKESVQIGTGVYLTPGPGQWYNQPGNWHCVISGSHDALKRVAKVWVPQTFEGHTMWWLDDEEIHKYIQNIEDSWDPQKTLRLSLIDPMPKMPGGLQMVIPFDLLNSRGGAMGIKAKCVEKLEDLPTEVVNYDDWKENIKGDRVSPSEDEDDDPWDAFGTFGPP